MPIGYPITTLFNNTCRIESIATSQDAVGGVVESITVTRTVSCRIRSLKGDEEEIVGKEGTISTHKIYFAGNEVINNTDRLFVPAINGRQFDVIHIDNKHEMNHHIEVWVKLRD